MLHDIYHEVHEGKNMKAMKKIVFFFIKFLE